jgi:hypothetical protein
VERPHVIKYMQIFTDGPAGMTMGWTGSFDKLEAVLAESAAA